MELLITPEGMVRCVYGEAIDVNKLGPVHIRRGSHVEPTADGEWMADLAPADGPTLGPFSSRSEALAAEVNWLRDHWLLTDK